MINVYKERGYTSHDVVAKLRGILKQKKIGHTGTLDPDAQGVLPVCLGKATKLCDMLTGEEKVYEAVLRLGITTDTQDMTGQVRKVREVQASPEEAREAVNSFVGEYDQIPPMYSARKVNGKKLYELAREGKEVERKARRVRIYEIVILECRLPLIRFTVRCSKGTYIRTLCQDIGEKLGCGGCMESLLRTQVGRFTLKDSLKLQQIQQLAENGQIGQILTPVDEMFGGMPAVTIKSEFQKLIQNGNAFLPGHLLSLPDEVGTGGGSLEQGQVQVRVYDEAGGFYGIYEYQTDRGRYQPVKMFLGD